VTLDRLLFLSFILVQCGFSMLWARAARRRWSGWTRLAAYCAILLFGLLFAAGYLCSFSRVSGRLHVPAQIATLLGAAGLAYILVGASVLVIYEIKKRIARHFDADTDPARRRAIQATGTILMAAPFAALGYGTFIERSNFHVREIDLPVPGMAPDLEGLRILQLSDIHLSAFLSEAELERVIDEAAGLRAHVAVITGDLISTHGDPLDACIRQLTRIKADAGVFGCNGNHELYAGVEGYTARACGRVGIRFLRHEACALRFGNSVLNLAGIDYQPFGHRYHYLRGVEQLLVPGACNVLLSHNPDVFPVAAQQGYNLMLSGHTHGGQVTVEILDQSISAARFFTPYVYGVYREGAATGYVTRGIGTIGLPARLGAPPEISLLRLRRA
jgi:hypothetical protein